MVALVLTFVNILLGVFAGQIWRLTHYKLNFKKLFAYCLSAFCVAVALVWNNVAGHVRDVYVFAEKTGQLEALDEAFCNSLPYDGRTSITVGKSPVCRISSRWNSCFFINDVQNVYRG